MHRDELERKEKIKNHTLVSKHRSNVKYLYKNNTQNTHLEYLNKGFEVVLQTICGAMICILLYLSSQESLKGDVIMPILHTLKFSDISMIHHQ